MAIGPPPMHVRFALPAVGLLFGACSALAQTPAADDFTQNPDSFLVPPPEAVCNALAKVPNIDFAKLAAQGAPPPDAKKIKSLAATVKAVHLGVRAADAYVAVQAKDVAAFRRAS